MKRNTFGKILSILLAVVMLASMLPATLLTASAEDEVATTSEVFGYANATVADSNISLLFKDDTYGGLHTITGAGALRIRVNSDKGDNADGKSWTATKIKFNNEDLTPGWYKLTMKTTTIYDHGASTKGFKLYMAEYDENKTTGEEYMASDDTFFVYTAPSSHALVRNASASTVTHDLGSVAITDMSKEYVLIIELQGKEYHIEDFTFTRTADFSTVESFAFKNSTSSGKDILTKYNEYGTDNPNWVWFGRDAAWAGTFSGITTGGQLRVRVDSTPGAAWMAFKVKFADPRLLAPGQFELSMNLNQIWPHGSSTRMTSFYLGEYDETKTSGADYMTAENLISAKSYVNSGSPVTYKVGKTYIYDTTKEYILVVKVQGEELYLTGFNLERVGELPTPVTGVTLDQNTATLMVDDQTTLTATVVPDDAANTAVTWSSSADGIATVDQNGVVTAVAPGKATITVTTADGGFTDTCDVTVQVKDYELIDFKAPASGKSNQLDVGYTAYGINNNPNWYVFDIAGGSWGSTGLRSCGESARFRIDAGAGENSDGIGWIAFKFKFSNEYIEEGSYQLVMNTTQSYTHGNSNKYADFFFAKYDPAKTTGEDYMDAGNVVAAKYVPVVTGSPKAHVIGNVVVDDMDAEYVLVMKNSGLDPHIDNFKLTRVGDAPTSEIISFAGANAHLHGGNWAEYGINNKNWKAYDLSDDYKNASAEDRVWAGSTAGSFFRFADLKAVPDAWSALKIRFLNPLEPGEYKLKYTTSNIYPGRDTSDIRGLAFYLAPIVDGKVAKDYIADYNAIKQLATTTKPGAADEAKTLETSTFYITDTSKEFAFVIELEGCEIYLHSLEFERVGDLPTDKVVELDYSRFSLQPGASAFPRIKYNGDSKILVAAVAPFEAENEDVISVTAAGTVKGINPGRSTVSTTVDGVKITSKGSFQVFDGALVSGTANVYVHSIVDGVAGTDGVTSTTGIVGNVAEVAIGTSVTATADEEVDGAKFSHWMTSGGTFITSSREYTFKANTNAVAIAVYDSEEATGDEVTVSFYTGFGRLIETVVGAVNDTFDIFAAGIDGNFRGYVFDTWESVDGVLEDDSVITKNTTVVAQYTEEPGKDFAISIDGATEYYAYNEEVTATSDDANFSYWTRDGKIVSYNPTYMFYAWDDATIASVCEGATAARAAVVLASDGDEYMVEYDLPAGYTFVETGIVGFASGSPTVGSFGSKASSKKLTGNHGQFTAVCDETKVRGYVMYKDASGNLLVSYAD